MHNIYSLEKMHPPKKKCIFLRYFKKYKKYFFLGKNEARNRIALESQANEFFYRDSHRSVKWDKTCEVLDKALINARTNIRQCSAHQCMDQTSLDKAYVKKFLIDSYREEVCIMTLAALQLMI